MGPNQPVQPNKKTKAEKLTAREDEDHADGEY